MGCDYNQEQLDWLTKHSQTYTHTGKNRKPHTNRTAFYYDDGTVELHGAVTLEGDMVNQWANSLYGWACNIGLRVCL